jgi:hypothetical protein
MQRRLATSRRRFEIRLTHKTVAPGSEGELGAEPDMDFPAFCGREKLTALPARRSADAYESEYGEDPSDL